MERNGSLSSSCLHSPTRQRSHFGCRAPRGSGFNPGGGRTPVGRTHARTRTPSRTARGCSRGRNSASARTAPVTAPASTRANRCARRRRPRAPMPPPAAPRARRDPVLRVRRARRDPVLRVRRLPAPSLRAPRPTRHAPVGAARVLALRCVASRCFARRRRFYLDERAGVGRIVCRVSVRRFAGWGARRVADQSSQGTLGLRGRVAAMVLKHPGFRAGGHCRAR